MEREILSGSFTETLKRARNLIRDNRIGLLIIVIGIFLRLLFIWYTGYADEDAYITFRFARNIASGEGFVYNPGQPIYGTTTPLLTFLLAAWIRLQGDPLIGARFIGLVATTAYLFFSARAVKALGGTRTQALFAIGILALSSRLIRHDISGMEMPILLAAMTASLDAGVRKNPYLAGLLGGVCLWVRVDALTWVGLLAIVAWVEDPRDALRLAGISVLTYTPWLLYATVTFGTPVPHTIVAKWYAYTLPTHPLMTDSVPLLESLRSISPSAVSIMTWLTPFEIHR